MIRRVPFCFVAPARTRQRNFFLLSLSPGGATELYKGPERERRPAGQKAVEKGRARSR